MGHFTELANQSGTDKGTYNSLGLSYSIIYDALFCHLRGKKVSVAEIGLQAGGPELGHSVSRETTDIPSVKVWEEYFTKPDIYGLDICDFSKFNSPQFTYVYVDSGNIESLKKAAAQLPDIDIFLDDGSHASKHQQLALIHMIYKVKPGGFYIIEDLHWQPLEVEKQFPETVKTRDILLKRPGMDLDETGKQFQETINSLDCIGIFSKAGLWGLRKDYNIINNLPTHSKDIQIEKSIRLNASNLYKALTSKSHKFLPHYIYLAIFQKPAI